MDDLIKRQDAITAYCEHECGIKGMTRENCGATDCGTIFDDIPSADVRENVRGEWLSGDCMGASCSKCGEYFSFRTFREVHNFNFCPNCGADMRQVAGKLKNSENSTLSKR